MSGKKYRLVTRSDFDGLVCAVLLRALDLIDDIKFVHPKDMQDGKIEIGNRDITTNLPYVETAHLAFDHHLSEISRVGSNRHNHIIDPSAPSAARVVWRHFGGRGRFATISEEMMTAVDKADSARYERDDILTPTGWTLLNFVMDARTGLGRFREFRISNYALMMELIEACRTLTIDQILELPDVKERTDLYFEHQPKFLNQLERCTVMRGGLAVVDLRDEETIYAGNRFMIYVSRPNTRISMHVLWGLKRQNTVFAVGRSIIDRSSSFDIGALMLTYGGGGHGAAGTCQVTNDRAETVKAELITRLADG